MKMMMVIMKERPKQSLSDEGIHIYCCQLIGGWHDSWGVAGVLPCALLFSFSHLIMMPIQINFDMRLDRIGWVASMTLGGWPKFCPVRFKAFLLFMPHDFQDLRILKSLGIEYHYILRM